MSDLNYLQHKSLENNSNVKHAFFTRNGGVSKNIYSSLNIGLSSNDNKDNIIENRNRVATSFSLSINNLCIASQIHSNKVFVIDNPNVDIKSTPEADAIVTNQKNIIISVLTADCTPILFYDKKNQIIGAAHSGWKGAINGIVDNTVEEMLNLGASLSSITAIIGPTIRQKSYEVDNKFRDNFINENNNNAQFFINSIKDNHYMFDLPSYIKSKLNNIQVSDIHDLEIDTYSNEDMFFSYRRKTHRNEDDYGRQISAICLY